MATTRRRPRVFKDRDWGRRFVDRFRPVALAAAVALMTSAGSAFGTYVYQQAELASAEHNWQQYFRAYWRGCEHQ